MLENGKLLTVIGELKNNTMILAKVKNVKTKRKLKDKKDKCIEKKDSEIKSVAKSYKVDLEKTENKKTENVRKIYTDYMTEYKKDENAIEAAGLACVQDANIEKVNLSNQRIENIKEVKVYKEVKKDILDTRFKDDEVTKNKVVLLEDEFCKYNLKLKAAEKVGDEKEIEEIKSKLAEIRNGQKLYLQEDFARYEEISLKLEDTLLENETLKNRVEELDLKAEEIEDLAVLEMDNVEETTLDEVENPEEIIDEETEVIEAEEIPEEETANEEPEEKKENKLLSKVKDAAVNLGKYAAVNYVVGSVGGMSVLEAYMLKTVCRRAIGCKNTIPTKIAYAYITDKDNLIDKSSQVIKDSGKFIKGCIAVKQGISKDGAFDYLTNVSKAALFGENKAKDIANKTIEKVKEQVKEKIVDIER